MRRLFVLGRLLLIWSMPLFSQVAPKWSFESAKEQMSDKMHAVWWLPASDTGRLRVQAYLKIQCSHGDDSLLVATGTTPDIKTMKNQNPIRAWKTGTTEVPVSIVNIRFDSERVTAEDWEQRQAIYDLYAPNPKKYIKKLLAAKTMLFLFTPYGENPVVYRFDVDGLRDYQNTLKWECKY